MKRFIVMLCALSLACQQEDGQIEVTSPQCELTVSPQGIDCLQPRLSWQIESPERGVVQKARRIIVASSPEKLAADEGDIWDSGKVKSSASVFVPYGGTALESRKTYFWKVQVLTNKGAGWSAPAQWSMGLLTPDDWQAKWTGLEQAFPDDVTAGATRLAARYFRKEFDAKEKPAKATLYISGLGLYKLYLNGQKTGDCELSPTPTDYIKVVKYNTFDVTDAITAGRNAIGTILGNGRYFSFRQPGAKHFGKPRMLLQLEIEYADGSKQTVVSDDTWKVTANGPIIANNEYDGEEYDARKEMPGWNATGFDDSKWLPAELVAAPDGKIEAQLNANIKVMEELAPKSIKELTPGTWILDMGQNMVGWLQMRVTGPAGTAVKLRFAETVNADGSLYMANLRSAKVTDVYTLKGSAPETWEPMFTYHGFRYVEITGFPGTPQPADFTGKVVYDEMETTGLFTTSDATINQVYKNAYWGIRGNYRGMPTDCPQRDERMGWLGDRAVGSHGESFIFNNHNLYAKWLDDIEQAQREDGSIPDVAPNYWPIYSDNMTWPGAYIIIANMLYEQFGDSQPLTKHYESMKKWMAYMHDKHTADHIVTKDTYGDWCMPPEKPELIHSKDPARKTDGAVLSTTFYYRMLTLLEHFANLQGKTDDAKAFSTEAKVVKDAYNAKFFDSKTAQYSNNTVTANLLSLCYGMVPDGFEDKVFANIVEKTEHDFASHISTGLVGVQWLMRGLSDHGRADLALKIATNRDYPSWGYMLENDATTIWELWNGNTADPAMNSHNHVMLLGDLIVWYYEYLAGIRNAPGSAAFEQIVMRPHVVNGLTSVNASYKSVRGLIKSSWKNATDKVLKDISVPISKNIGTDLQVKLNGKFQWDITIPGNATATVWIPASDAGEVTESGVAATSASGVKYLRKEGGYVLFKIGSGKYSFVSE
ncbi:MAG: glycoside hydrolase family 78 protein [Bacteroidales bacterium]|jgi:alpha-L-rhamnosidase|nr:glycoside hydrolase family 78 protein [Bacteroidales bacterium]